LYMTCMCSKLQNSSLPYCLWIVEKFPF
jgi:hypothetical protein